MALFSTVLPPVEQARIEIGDPLPEFDWLDPQGEPVSLYTDSRCGRPTAIFLCRSAGSVAAELTELRDRADEFEALGVQVLVVASDAPALNQATAKGIELPFALVSDVAFAAGRGFGIEPAGSGKTWAAIVVNPNLRVERVVADETAESVVAAALDCLRAAPALGRAEVLVSHPPVLVVPNVLEPELCADLIRSFENGERYAGGLTNEREGDYYLRPAVKSRTDVAVPDTDAEAQQVFANFRKRVFPEMFKAFRYRVTRAETMRIGCYVASDGGKFGPHRDDNTPKTSHRRFGFTINLNVGEYEGGLLRFPEYGPQLYAPANGHMVVFSVSLLHEATPVTAGRRYGLFGFLFGEAEEAWRKRQNPSFDSMVVDSPAGSHHVGPGTH